MSLLLKTVLMAGRPIWSPGIHVLPFHQVVWPQTPMWCPRSVSGTSSTMALAFSPEKKSVTFVPSRSVPTWKTVPTNPVRSKKNGSERTPAKNRP